MRYEWPESPQFRAKTMKLLSDVLSDPNGSTRNVSTLTIKNMQNINDQKLVHSDKFKTVLGRLQRLNLFIVTEAYEAAPEYAITEDEVHTFYEDFPSTWLQPLSSKLTQLNLYCDTYFGYCPFLDLRNVHLPNLHVLALGNYSFSHDWQIDWILSHSSTLRALYLDDCHILYGIQSAGLDDEGYVGRRIRASVGERRIITYTKRWHDYFESFQKGLPNLRDFKVGHGVWRGGDYDDEYADTFEQPQTLTIGFRKDRYMFFNDSIGPSQFTDEREDYPTCYDEDRRALEALLISIQNPIPESRRLEGCDWDWD